MKTFADIRRTALVLALLLGLAGFGAALYELLSPQSGTTGTAGAALVTVSTALLSVAAAVLAFVRVPRWLYGLLLTLVLVATVATAAAGYFLMASLLVAAMLGALLAGIAAAAVGRGRSGAAS